MLQKPKQTVYVVYAHADSLRYALQIFSARHLAELFVSRATRPTERGEGMSAAECLGISLAIEEMVIRDSL